MSLIFGFNVMDILEIHEALCLLVSLSTATGIFAFLSMEDKGKFSPLLFIICMLGETFLFT